MGSGLAPLEHKAPVWLPGDPGGPHSVETEIEPEVVQHPLYHLLRQPAGRPEDSGLKDYTPPGVQCKRCQQAALNHLLAGDGTNGGYPLGANHRNLLCCAGAYLRWGNNCGRVCTSQPAWLRIS